MKMFSKILIANRGEIACRIARTAHRLGINCVAVYSDADANAKHVASCEEAVHIGPAPPLESYLCADTIIAAALRTGVQAIHPGYGFLSENADFAEACTQSGLIFIGAPAMAIRTMGNKSAAKALMETTGVPLVPGYHGEVQGHKYLKREAARIGYPVLIKASAGGGGRGMHIVEREEDFEAMLTSCKREAASSFGNDQVLMEKYLQRPRHIEIQIFADEHANCVYLFERDCSVQRRHQKVIEEAPAPGMTGKKRKQMGKAAVAAAKAVGYVGAGTVEFITHQDGTFYFMEMNTRLQVEHPVTEMITGVDLVEWQLRIACGEPIHLTQEQLSIHGHALEARIYAEDPANNFFPSTGTLQYLLQPEESLHVRVDTGIEQGAEISPYYDPLLAKLIVWDINREAALSRMLHALAQYRIVGVANNVEFLQRLIACPAFVRADLDTGLIEREQKNLFVDTSEMPREIHFIAALATLLFEQNRTQHHNHNLERCSPWDTRTGWRLNGLATRSINFRYKNTEKKVVIHYGSDSFYLEIDGMRVLARGEIRANSTLHVELNGLQFDAMVIVTDDLLHIFWHGCCYRLAHLDATCFSGELDTPEGALAAPMPGTVIALLVDVGQTVRKGTPLIILQAMKMEYTISAPFSGKVKALRYAVGEQVTAGVELIEFEPHAG